MEFTNREIEAIEKLVSAWQAFVLLPTEHPSDVSEFRNAIQHAQLLIIARPGRRFINDGKPNSPPYTIRETTG